MGNVEACEKLSQSDKSILRNYCRSFYIKAIVQLQQRFEFKDDFYSIIRMVFPKNVRGREPQTLTKLFNRFPDLMDACIPAKAEQEWRSLALHLPATDLGLQTEDELLNLSVEAFWILVLNLQCSSGPRFPQMAVIMSYLFSLPSSNVIAETVFSFLKLTKTELRNGLKNETLLGFMRMKYLLKNSGKTSATLQFSDDLVDRWMKVRANKTLPAPVNNQSN